MLEIMMHSGGYRIEYLNLHAAGTDLGFGLYVCGKLEKGQPYSRQARYHLLAGLERITRSQNLENLVAVYVDICSRAELGRPARQQLMKDLAVGMFKKVMLYTPEEILVSAANSNEIEWIHVQSEFGSAKTISHPALMPVEPCQCNSMN
jgi:hypothetical protein